MYRQQYIVFRFLQLIIQEAQRAIDNTHILTVKVINFKKIPIENAVVKIFRLEKEPISPEQWVENLRNGTSFNRLILSGKTDSNGTVTAELTSGTHEVKVEGYALGKIFDVTQNDEVLLTEPKKHWW
jgi:hypothetical protein